MIKLFRVYALLFCSVSLGHDFYSVKYWHQEIDEVIKKIDLFGNKPEMFIWSHLVAKNKDLEQRDAVNKLAIKGIIKLRIINRFKVLRQYHPIYNKH